MSQKIIIKDSNEIITYELRYIYEMLLEKSYSIQIKKEGLLNQIYEQNFFEIIRITGDGNCFFRTVSFYLYDNENQHATLREASYKYVKDNMTQFYEYCYIENDIYYIDIEEGNSITKYNWMNTLKI